MKILDDHTSKGWTDRLTDPHITLAERLLNNRQSRNQFLGPELFGEPAWEILLTAFVALGKSRQCAVQALAEETHLSRQEIHRWIELLAARDLIEDRGPTIALTQHADGMIRKLFSACSDEMANEFGAGEGSIQFSSGAVSEGE